MKRPLHNKCRHVTAPVLVNNRFEVLATNAATSDAVLDDTHVNKTVHQEYRACKQQAEDIKNSMYVQANQIRLLRWFQLIHK